MFCFWPFVICIFATILFLVMLMRYYSQYLWTTPPKPFSRLWLNFTELILWWNFTIIVEFFSSIQVGLGAIYIFFFTNIWKNEICKFSLCQKLHYSAQFRFSFAMRHCENLFVIKNKKFRVSIKSKLYYFFSGW
jgi:hypothetical protein